MDRTDHLQAVVVVLSIQRWTKDEYGCCYFMVIVLFAEVKGGGDFDESAEGLPLRGYREPKAYSSESRAASHADG